MILDNKVINWLKKFYKQEDFVKDDEDGSYYELVYGDGNIGTVESCYNNTFVISKDTWAPGIWAGTKGMTIMFKDNNSKGYSLPYIINFVDLHTRNIGVYGDLMEVTDCEIHFVRVIK